MHHNVWRFFLFPVKLKPDLVKISLINKQNVFFILSLSVCISHLIPLPSFYSERILKKQIYCPFLSKMNFNCNKIQCLSIFYFLDFIFKIIFGRE